MVIGSSREAADQAVKMIDQLAELQSQEYVQKPQTAMATAGHQVSNLAMVQEKFDEVAMFKTEPEKRLQEE